jgi:hypothetical protein
MTAEAVPAGRWARWLLLVSTLFGLAVMHTFGHAALTGTGPHTTTVSAAGMQIAALPAAMSDAVGMDVCDHDHCRGHGGHGAMSGWSVCMAILQGLAVLVLLAVVALALKRRPLRRRPAGPGVRISRAPPPRRQGLALTTTTVLRI